MVLSKHKDVANYLDSQDISNQNTTHQQTLDLEKILGDYSIPSIKKGLEDNGIDYVKVGVFDIDGILRGKYMKREKFLSALSPLFSQP